MGFFRRSACPGESLDASKSPLRKIYISCPQLLGYGVEGLRQKDDFFAQHMNMTATERSCMYRAMPKIFTYSVEKNIKPTVDYLRGAGVSGAGLKRTMMKYPNILTCSVKNNLEPKVGWLRERVGLDHERGHVGRFISMFPPCLWLRTDNLDSKISYLERTFSYSSEDLRNLLVTMPQVLGLALDENIRATVEFYLAKGLSREELGEALSESPSLLAYSLEKRIKPRVREMEDMGIELRYCPLYVIGLCETQWRKWLEGQEGTWTACA